MVLQDGNKELAIKWGLALIRQGKGINDACEISAKWYKTDSKEVKKYILNPQRVNYPYGYV